MLNQSPAATARENIYDPLTWDPSLGFVRYSIGAVLIGSVLFLLAILLFFPDLQGRVYAPLPPIGVALLAWYLVQRDRLRAAIMTLAIGMWSSTTVMVFLNGGIRAPAFYIYPMLIMLTGWLLGARLALITAGLTCVITVLFIAGEHLKWPIPARSSPSLLMGIVQICSFLISAILVNSVVRSYKKHLEDLHTIHQGSLQRAHDLEIIKAELHQAQAVAKVGSWVYDLATDNMRLSDETCRIFGLPPGTTGNYQSYLGRTHPDDHADLEAAWRKALRGDSVFDYEHRIVIGTRIFWVRQKAQMTLGPDGTVTHAVGITQDITERKLTELDLRQSEKKFATAFTSCPLAASISTLQDGRFIEVNDNFKRDFGWSKTDLICQTSLELGLWPDPLMRQKWLDAIKTKGHVVDYETVLRHKNGQARKVSISGEMVDMEGVPCILSYITDITARKAADEQIQNLAFFDPLTDLPNRRLLMDRLEQALAAAFRHQRRGALLFIDLDHFKILNDIHGHDKGDLLLQQVAQRLRACRPENKTVARLGGDEFVVMLEDLHGDSLDAATQVEAVAEVILSTLNESYLLGTQTYNSTPSIGVTLFGDRQENLEEPLRRADLAMYQAKSAGRNTIRFFDPQMQAVVTARVMLELELREALVQQQFMLRYQPQVDDTGTVVGAEALVCWNHPQRGLVSPAEFIPLAEDTGLILPLGKWILEQACRQLAGWAEQPTLAALCVAINVSARQFQQTDFVAQVLDALAQSGVSPSRIKLELTESVLVYNSEDVRTKMRALKAHGVGFSLDDFGTGYSSLAYLKQLPLDQLKIDQTFVRDILDDPNDAAIARMVIVLAESLGLTVIAEGVETAAQRDALRSQGCHTYQGYLYSRPLPAPAFEAYMQAHQPAAQPG